MQMTMPGIINPAEAPPGFYAIAKSDAKKETRGANICRACDWRPNCDGSVRCMSYTAITSDGRALRREDGCSVVFKKEPAA